MAEIVAGALSFGFPLMVYKLDSDKKNSQSQVDVSGCSPKGKDPELNLSAALRDVFGKSQRCIDSFTDECKFDMSQELYRRSIAEGQCPSSSKSVEPPWFRNVVQSDVAAATAHADIKPYVPKEAEYPWLSHPVRCELLSSMRWLLINMIPHIVRTQDLCTH